MPYTSWCPWWGDLRTPRAALQPLVTVATTCGAASLRLDFVQPPVPPAPTAAPASAPSPSPSPPPPLLFLLHHPRHSSPPSVCESGGVPPPHRPLPMADKEQMVPEGEARVVVKAADMAEAMQQEAIQRGH